MTHHDETIARILRSCEEEGLAPRYVVGGGEHPVIVRHDAKGREVIVISDLHMAAGLDADGLYGGTENFFNDGAFARFVDTMRGAVRERGGTLIINGDVIDFLRVIETPRTTAQYEEWSRMLAAIGMPRSAEELAGDIVPKERTYGFKTHEHKSVWRLRRAMAGHPELFAALARWLADRTNELIIVKGNHDLEWYWRGVRDALRLALAEEAAPIVAEPIETVLVDIVLPNLHVIDDAIVIDTDLYVEHGHRYDRFTYVLGEPAMVYDTKRGEKELNIPFGSFFNRYLLNRLEGVYPFIDNIRPRENILPIVMRERFPLALNLLFRHVWLLILVLKKEKRYVRFMLARVFSFLAVLALPLGLLGFALAEGLLPSLPSTPTVTDDPTLLERGAAAVMQGLSSIGGLLLSYLLARLVAWLQLEEPSSLDEPARNILRNTDYRFVTMGHTHNPGQFQIDGRWFYNTGTWIPIVEASSAELRSDRVYTFLHLERDEASGRLRHRTLQCWHDAAGRGEHLAIVRREE